MADEAVVAQKGPYQVELSEGKPYFYCRCGRSQSQPFCDGSHKDTGIEPLRFVVDHTGNIASMLERTGADVGSTKPLYRHAEYFVFCSAKLSREMMEADPTNIGICPFVIFAYERADKAGEIVVGFRNPPVRGGDASRKSLEAVTTLLKDIVEEAVK